MSAQSVGPRPASGIIIHGPVGSNPAVVAPSRANGASSIGSASAPVSHRRRRNGPPQSFSCYNCITALFRALFRCLFGWMYCRNNEPQNRENPRSPVEDRQSPRQDPVIRIDPVPQQPQPAPGLEFPLEDLGLLGQSQSMVDLPQQQPVEVQQPQPAEDPNHQQVHAFLAMFSNDEEFDEETFLETFKTLPASVQKAVRESIVSKYASRIKEIKSENQRAIAAQNQNRERGEPVRRYIPMTDDEAALQFIERMQDGPSAVKICLEELVGIVEEGDDE